MAMSFGGNEGLFKLAESAAPDENRLMPSERTYLKSSSTVSVEEAVALMKQRKKNPDLRIKGGLDDTSDSVKRSKLGKDARKLVKDEVVDAAEAASVEPLGITDGGLVSLEAKPRRRRRSDDALAKVMADIDARMATLQKSLAARTSQKEAVPEDKLTTFKSGSHKVVFKLNGMEMTVKCLHMIKDADAHTVVFVFDDSGDSFFTPPKESELRVKYDGVDEPGVLFYFGMLFTVKALGLKFLGFLYDDEPRGQSDSE